MKSKAPYLLISLVVILVDQGSKYWAQNALLLYEPVKLLDILNLTLARNTGAAFSFLDSASGWQGLFFMCVNTTISFFVLVWLVRLKEEGWIKPLALSLVLGGAIGNLIDRARLGYVVDFLDFHWKHYHWPIFNAADSAVCIGMVLLMIDILFFEKDS